MHTLQICYWHNTVLLLYCYYCCLRTSYLLGSQWLLACHVASLPSLLTPQKRIWVVILLGVKNCAMQCRNSYILYLHNAQIKWSTKWTTNEPLVWVEFAFAFVVSTVSLRTYCVESVGLCGFTPGSPFSSCRLKTGRLSYQATLNCPWVWIWVWIVVSVIDCCLTRGLLFIIPSVNWDGLQFCHHL